MSHPSYLWGERWEEFHTGWWNLDSYARALGIKRKSVERQLYREARRRGVAWSPSGRRRTG